MVMLDREKVIMGLECCTNQSPTYCRQCPYKRTPDDYPHCVHMRLQADALALLRKQEQTVTGWVSVDDELPESKGIYITTNRFGEVSPMRYYTNCWCGMNGGVYLDGWVTHWMPLPEPPEEVSGDADGA